jgi:hypothetical protein
LFQPLRYAVFIVFTGCKLLPEDWRGYVIAEFSPVFIANVYMGLFAIIRQSIKKEKVKIKVLEKEIS